MKRGLFNILGHCPTMQSLMPLNLNGQSHLEGISGVYMIDDSIIDEKGRVCIPLELRKRLKMTAGEKVRFQVDDGKLIIMKTTTPEQFSEAVSNFKAQVKKTTNKPMTLEKIF